MTLLLPLLYLFCPAAVLIPPNPSLQMFVHCASGVSRAPTMVISYLVRSKRISLGDAFNYVVACRPSVYPNDGFMFQLAMQEVNLGYGTSVRNVMEFSNYEYNLQVKSDYNTYRGRSNKGVYRTCLKLHQKRVTSMS